MDNRRLYLLLGTVAVLLLVFFIFTRPKASKFNWRETYLEAQKDPYGSYVLHQLLSSYYADHTFKEIGEKVAAELPARTSNPASYVLLGEGMYLDSTDVARLLQFVRNGNQAFLASKTIPFDLMFDLYYEECNGQFWDDYSYIEDSLVTVNFFHPDLRQQGGFQFEYVYRHQPEVYSWNFIEHIYFCENEKGLKPLGFLDSMRVNFVQVPYGDGSFFLHTNPLVFTNFHLLDTQGLAYASRVFSHLPAGTIYWDKVSRVDETIGRRHNDRLANKPTRRFSSDSPLKYILAQPPLAWAWYLGLLLGLAYLLFHAKRRQREIPVLAAKRNTSMEFLATIGSLHFMKQDHKKLALQKTKLMLAYIRERYHLGTHELDETFVSRLSERAEVPNSLIRRILQQRQAIHTASRISEKELIDYHQAMDQFYKQCK